LASAKVCDDPLKQPDLHFGLTDAFKRGLFDYTETVAALQAFRKRHADAQRIHGQLSSQPTAVDFTYYRSILKNQNIVNEAEKLLKDFKPVTYDVNAHVKTIEAFEEKAVCLVLLILERCTLFTFISNPILQVEKAQETAAQIDLELKELQSTLANIEDARPFEDLTVRLNLGTGHFGFTHILWE
jgi:hypothetical protein